MWVQAGFEPDSFWQQTPATYQACMTGVRARLGQEAEGQIAQAYHTARFNAATKTKEGLKPLKHYLRQAPRKMSAKEMLANMRILAQRVNSKGSKS